MTLYPLEVFRWTDILLQLIENDKEEIFEEYINFLIAGNYTKTNEGALFTKALADFKSKDKVQVIELLTNMKERNMGLIFDKPCSLNWVNLNPTEDERVRHCPECKRNVFRVDNKLEYLKRRQLNQCVSINFEPKEKYERGTGCEVSFHDTYQLLGSPVFIDDSNKDDGPF